MSRLRWLGPFLDELERRLEVLDAHRLRSLLLEHARGLPARERENFLAVFPPAGRGVGAANPESAPAGPDARLLEDIDAFVAEVRDGAFLDGWGWDDHLHEERPFGDDLWTIDADGLLAGAERAFLSGDLDLAREAYGRLLSALGDDYDGEGGFPTLDPDAELDTDVTEAKARYLRALYDTVAADERVARMLEAARRLAYVGGEVSLADVESTRREPLAEVDRFLASWIEALLDATGERDGFGRQARRLLAEAVERHRGLDGLAELARRPSADRARAYRDWVEALVRDGRDREAEAAGIEALAELPAEGSVQATIAERLADLAAERGDTTAVMEARRAAWRAAPTGGRLAAVVAAAIAAGKRDEVLTAEADRAARSKAVREEGALHAALLLLAGRVDAAAKLLSKERSRPRWGYGKTPGAVVTPFLLITASEALAHPEFDGSLLAKLLDATEGIGSPWSRLKEAEVGTHKGAGLRELMRQALADQRPTAAQARRWFDAARDAVDREVDDVVGTKDRPAYRSVAALAVAAAEASCVRGGTDTAVTAVEAMHARYPRHSAFRRELDAAVRRSPLVPNTAARK